MDGENIDWFKLNQSCERDILDVYDYNCHTLPTKFWSDQNERKQCHRTKNKKRKIWFRPHKHEIIQTPHLLKIGSNLGILLLLLLLLYVFTTVHLGTLKLSFFLCCTKSIDIRVIWYTICEPFELVHFHALFYCISNTEILFNRNKTKKNMRIYSVFTIKNLYESCEIFRM